jgi:hypothetical protein
MCQMLGIIPILMFRFYALALFTGINALGSTLKFNDYQSRNLVCAMLERDRRGDQDR